MRREQIDVLEEWFRWADEWSVLLRIYGQTRASSNVLEIGCGLGRTAFPLRFVLTVGTYDGFDICAYKIEFLRRVFEPRYPNFRFRHADVQNTRYNPQGTLGSSTYRFEFDDESFDVVYAASVFTHLVPDGTARYFREAGRVLRPGGRAVFSIFLLDWYRPSERRPPGFDNRYFDFDYSYEGYGNDFAIVDPANPEETTAYSSRLLEQLARDAGLRLVTPPLAGLWSGAADHWVAAQDLLVLEKAPPRRRSLRRGLPRRARNVWRAATES